MSQLVGTQSGEVVVPTYNWTAMFAGQLRKLKNIKQFHHFSMPSSEALSVPKKWNLNWKPSYFLCDFSDAEFSALQLVFPRTTVYGCDFHREQA